MPPLIRDQLANAAEEIPPIAPDRDRLLGINSEQPRIAPRISRESDTSDTGSRPAPGGGVFAQASPAYRDHRPAAPRLGYQPENLQSLRQNKPIRRSGSCVAGGCKL